MSFITIYNLVTISIFCYTFYDQLAQSDNYFSAILAYFTNNTYVFIIYNFILALAMISYQVIVTIFFEVLKENQILKMISKLKIKILDLIFFMYIIDLQFNLQTFSVTILVTLAFVIHNFVIFRAQFLIHVHNVNLSLKLNYKLIALFVILFFIDFEIIKVYNLFTITDRTSALFVYYIFSISMSIIEPFVQFVIDFYEKYTYNHFKNADEFLALVSLLINVPRLVFQFCISLWISIKFSQHIFLLISIIESYPEIKQTIVSYLERKKLTKSMQNLTRLKGQQLNNFHDVTCTVCYEQMKEAILLPCKHIFHDQCIKQWIFKNSNHFCPKCKKHFNFDQIQAEVPDPQIEQRRYVFLNQRNQFMVRRNLKTDQPQIKQNSYKRRQSQQLEQSDAPQIHRSASQRIPSHFNKQTLKKQHKESIEQFDRESSCGNEQIEEVEIIEKSNRPKKYKQSNRRKRFIIERQNMEDYPLEFYQKMKKNIVPLGSLPFGMPTPAISYRKVKHMRKRRQYEDEIDIITKLLSLNRVEQMLLI